MTTKERIEMWCGGDVDKRQSQEDFIMDTTDIFCERCPKYVKTHCTSSFCPVFQEDVMSRWELVYRAFGVDLGNYDNNFFNLYK